MNFHKDNIKIMFSLLPELWCGWGSFSKPRFQNTRDKTKLIRSLLPLRRIRLEIFKQCVSIMYSF